MIGGRALQVRLLPALLLGAVLALGVTKTYVGIERHRPVGFLLPQCFVTAVLIVLLVAKAPVRTRRGSRLLAALRRHNAALRTNAARAPEMLAGNDVALAFALFGPAVFTTGVMDDLRRTLAPPREGGSGCGGSSGCGSGSSDGGGGMRRRWRLRWLRGRWRLSARHAPRATAGMVTSVTLSARLPNRSNPP